MKPISRDFDGVSHKNIDSVQGVRSDQTTGKIEWGTAITVGPVIGVYLFIGVEKGKQ